MAHEALQTIVGSAIVDPGFQHGLLNKAPGILNEFELTPEERAFVLGIQADTLQGFAQELHRWISRKSAVEERPAFERSNLVPAYAY